MLQILLNNSLKEALKAKDVYKINAIRLINAKIKDQEIKLRSQHDMNYQLSDDAIIDIIQYLIKQSRESLEFYEKAQRCELIKKEQSMLMVMQSFLPKQLSNDELTLIIQDIIAKNAFTNIKEIKSVLQALKSDYAGQFISANAVAITQKLLNK